jgi:hypothetical protein
MVNGIPDVIGFKEASVDLREKYFIHVLVDGEGSMR